MEAIYDTFGRGYSKLRVPEPSIRRLVRGVVGSANSVLNVGAGAGSYEPTDAFVVGADVSRTMLGQRPSDAGPAVQADAMALPFPSDAFDAGTAILTLHHWLDLRSGLLELARVAKLRVVVLTWDPSHPGFWLTDYFPEIWEIDREIFPTIGDIKAVLGGGTVDVVPIPRDCTDGFLGAYWRRPAAYLDPAIRQAISTFSKLQGPEEQLDQLRRDLDSGEWRRRYGGVLVDEQMDLGYRLIVSDL